MPPSTGAEKSQMLSAISQQFPFNIPVFCLPRYMIFQLSSKVPLWMPAKDYSCPWKWLLSPCLLSPPRPLDGCVHDPVHSQICVPPLVLLRACEDPDAMTFLVGRVTSEFGHCWKESPVVWYPNHDAACFAPLNVDLLGESSQESSLFTNVIPDWCLLPNA